MARKPTSTKAPAEATPAEPIPAETAPAETAPADAAVPVPPPAETDETAAAAVRLAEVLGEPADTHADAPAFDNLAVNGGADETVIAGRHLLVRALAPSRWRGGLEFGVTARLLTEPEIAQAAAAKGISVLEWVRLLGADPQLVVVSVA